MNMKRMRGRGHRSGGGGSGGGGGLRHHSGNIPLNRNHVFDSSGPDLRIRGTAQQLFERYLQLGRDASSSGDRVMAESYFQHAEHYFRILNAMAQAAQGPGGTGDRQPNGGGRETFNRRPTMEGAEGGGSQEDEGQDPLVPSGPDASGAEQSGRDQPMLFSEPHEPADA